MSPHGCPSIADIQVTETSVPRAARTCSGTANGHAGRASGSNEKLGQDASYCQIWCMRADQAATLPGLFFRFIRATFCTSTPSRNFTPATTFASHSNPRNRRQLRSAHRPSLLSSRAFRRGSDILWRDRSGGARWRSSTRLRSCGCGSSARQEES